MFFFFASHPSRTLSHSITAFNLPTAYNVPGQENISDEDDKEKVLVDPKTADVKEYTKIQVEDIVKGWIRYIKKVLKSYQNKVNTLSVADRVRACGDNVLCPVPELIRCRCHSLPPNTNTRYMRSPCISRYHLCFSIKFKFNIMCGAL